MCWFMANGVLCYALLLISKRLNIELLCILVFVILIWYVARIPIMIVIPALTSQPIDWYFGTNVDLGADEINNALRFVFYSSSTTAIGIVLSNSLFERKVQIKNHHRQTDLFIHQENYFKKASNFLLICILLSLFLYFYAGIGRYHKYWHLEVATRFVNISVLLLMFYYLYFSLPYCDRRRNLARFLLVLATVLLFFVLRGSRAFAYVLLVNTLAILLVKDRGKTVKLRNVLLVVILGVLTYMVAFGFKIGRDPNINSPSKVLRAVIASNTFIKLKNGVFDISRRLNALGPLATVLAGDSNVYDAGRYINRAGKYIGFKNQFGMPGIIARNCDVYKPEEYINFKNEFGAVINKFVVGELFPGAKDTDTTFDIIYRDWPEDEPNYHTSLWTGYGLMYIHYGYAGSLIALCILGFIINSLYKYSKRINRYGQIFSVVILIQFHEFLLSHGFDTLMYGIVGAWILIVPYNILLRIRLCKAIRR